MTARPDNVTDHTYHWALGALAAALALAAFEATPADAAAPAAGRVTVPARVTPGRLVTINVSGFAPGARVHVEWGVYFNPPANCCITKLVPPASKPGFTLAAPRPCTCGCPGCTPRAPPSAATIMTGRASSPASGSSCSSPPTWTTRDPARSTPKR